MVPAGNRWRIPLGHGEELNNGGLTKTQADFGKQTRNGVAAKNYPLWNHHHRLGQRGREEGQSPEPSEGTCGLCERDLAR